jgi:tetratricopeptide (TPR) repeat protein
MPRKPAAHRPTPNKRTAKAAAWRPPDRAAMQAFRAAHRGRALEGKLDQAQELIHRAWETTGRQACINLARRALEISPLCADAYVLLAEESAQSLPEASDLYARGVEAGEFALGPRSFKEDVGHFWGLLETRPYMRARCGLAQTLWALGEREAAIAHYRDLLRLNPNDNQGVRDLLAACLLTIGDDAGLAQLLEQYDEDAGTTWCYTKTLLAFRTGGDCKRARSRLAEALESNAHVPAYLAGSKKVPRELPPYVTWGGEDEAAEYARAHGTAWHATSGAVDWLAQASLEQAPPRRSQRRSLE